MCPSLPLLRQVKSEPSIVATDDWYLMRNGGDGAIIPVCSVSEGAGQPDHDLLRPYRCLTHVKIPQNSSVGQGKRAPVLGHTPFRMSVSCFTLREKCMFLLSREGNVLCGCHNQPLVKILSVCVHVGTQGGRVAVLFQN